jgi:hypothetical protein
VKRHDSFLFGLLYCSQLAGGCWHFRIPKNHSRIGVLGAGCMVLGAKYKEHYRGFNEKQWTMYYLNTKVVVNADVEILQTGTID